MSANKNSFVSKYGTVAHIDEVIARAGEGTILSLMTLAKNPSMTHEQHKKILAFESQTLDKQLISHQKHLHSDLVEEIAHKNGTYVATDVVNHPNTTSRAIDHVLNSLDGGPNHPDYDGSKVVNNWKAKRDELKAQGK